jgi:hypothetical protein
VGARANSVVLGGLLLLAAVACGGGDRGESFELYHLETAIGPPGAGGELHCGPPRAECPGVLHRPPPRVFRYEVRGPPAVTGDQIDRDGVRVLTGAPAVTVALTADGRRAFARLTKEVARIGGRDQGWHHVAVVVGDEIVAFPEVDFDVNPNGIPDAPAVEVVAASAADARELVRRLRGG